MGAKSGFSGSGSLAPAPCANPLSAPPCIESAYNSARTNGYRSVKFTILSHAGLLLEHAGKQILIDPWLVGSCYWRSWWNYPPVSPQLVESLQPDYIFLTHLHWDHFHGPSLRKFSRSTPVVIPKDHFTRMLDDLRAMKFENVIELPHGGHFSIAPDFRVSSYHFLPTTDSALVIEAGQYVVLDANDCKLMGLPLKQLKKRHPRIDFLLRSHSSANDRLCYEFTDTVNVYADDPTRYSELFAAFTNSIKPRYAIPFASNHCHLHADTFHYNLHIQTPDTVARDFAALVKQDGAPVTEVVTMISGDSWDEQRGFTLQAHDYFSERPHHLAEYRLQVQDKLRETQAKEDKAQISLPVVAEYFAKFTRAIPWPVRLMFRQTPLLFVLKSGAGQRYFRYELPRGKVEELAEDPAGQRMLRFFSSAALFQHAMRSRMFAHMSISKRVIYRVQRQDLRRMQLFNLLLKLYEYELIPLHRLFRWRLVEAYARRWREVILYLQIGIDVWLRRLDPLAVEHKYLDAPAASTAGITSPANQ